jgi:hypothetical protein
LHILARGARGSAETDKPVNNERVREERKGVGGEKK